MAGDLKRGMGSIEKNGNRYWWNVKLPGEEERQRIPLTPEGADKPTDDYAVAVQLVKLRYRRAAMLAKSKEATGCDNTIAGLVRDYMEYARMRYRNGKEVSTIELSLRPLVEQCPMLPGENFGPKKAKQVRQIMMDQKRPDGQSWFSREEINRRVNIWRRMFKWAVSEERVSAHVLTGLKTVEGLSRGRCGDIREPDPVKPVDPVHVEAVFPFTSPQIVAMLRLQLLTGMRSGEVTIMRPCDIDRTSLKDDNLWIYTPSRHKTQHHGHERRVYLNVPAQDVLAPFLLGRKADAYLFSPTEANEWRRARQSEARVTPMNEGNKPGTNRKEDPKTQPGEVYDSAAYCHAVAKAIKKANRPIEQANVKREAEGLEPEPLIPHWHPHQIRHWFATKVRKYHGLEAAQVLLGHARADITQLYAEANTRKAVEAVKALKAG